MQTNTIKSTVKWMGSTAGVIACCVAFTPKWEGMDKVARRDAIGTGHPITYCYGQTDEFGKVKVGQKFTKAECDKALAESLPKYLDAINKCIHVDMSDKTKAAYLDASYNAGAGAVCKSPMVAKANKGDLHGGCLAFKGWYISSDGQVRSGLIARRSGTDSRESEMQLCLDGLKDVTATLPVMDYPGSSDNASPRAGCGRDGLHCLEAKPTFTQVHKRHMLKPHVVVCTGFLWTRECK